MPTQGRLGTGVAGLDEMLGGGLPAKSVTLLRGGPGAGKSTLAMQFLVEGARRGEKGLYLTLEEPIAEVLEHADAFGWDARELVRKGELAIHTLTLTRVKDYLKDSPGAANWLASIESSSTAAGLSGEFRSDVLSSILLRLISESGAKRLVLDSLTMFTSQFEHRVDLHMETLDLIRQLAKAGTTTIFIAHADPSGAHTFAAEEYLSHGVINLHYVQHQARVTQAIQVLKMRGAAHDRELRPYRIGESGFAVYPQESVLGGF